MTRAEIDHAVRVIGEEPLHGMDLIGLPLPVDAPDSVGRVALGLDLLVVVPDLLIITPSDIVHRPVRQTELLDEQLGDRALAGAHRSDKNNRAAHGLPYTSTMPAAAAAAKNAGSSSIPRPIVSTISPRSRSSSIGSWTFSTNLTSWPGGRPCADEPAGSGTMQRAYVRSRLVF